MVKAIFARFQRRREGISNGGSPLQTQCVSEENACTGRRPDHSQEDCVTLGSDRPNDRLTERHRQAKLARSLPNGVALLAKRSWQRRFVEGQACLFFVFFSFFF